MNPTVNVNDIIGSKSWSKVHKGFLKAKHVVSLHNCLQMASILLAATKLYIPCGQ